MKITYRRTTVALSLLFVSVFGAIAAACNDDSSSSSSDTTDAGADLTGDPVTIGVMYVVDEAAGVDNSKVEMAIQAAIDAKEADGGLNGSPIELEVCTFGLNDPNGATECAEEFAANESIVATVGNQHGEGDTTNPILEDASLVAIGQGPISFGDFSSPISFPVSSGALGVGGAGTILVDELDLTDIDIGLIDLEGAAQTTVLVNLALETRGTEISGEVTLPTDKQDLSAEATQLAEEGDASIIATVPEVFSRYMTSAESVGALDDHPISTADAIATPDVIDTLGDLAEGVYVVTGGLAADGVDAPGIRRYNDQLMEYGDFSESDGLTKNAWLSTQVFFAASEGLNRVTRENVLDSMNQLTYDSEGLAPVLDFSQPSDLLDGVVTRAFNQSVMYAQVQEGAVVALSPDFVDIFEAS